eukprot:TRINITY_DN13151_c0_g2_i1.p1 TRINITY_DN13151_c0_g2~~TRINITY_DN13151_c0_g2_i1.p1  ORF type:complete len:420 (+),score=118.60 TRINITY_DN13151_c0_g2_i1:69-1328(+)
MDGRPPPGLTSLQPARRQVAPQPVRMPAQGYGSQSPKRPQTGSPAPAQQGRPQQGTSAPPQAQQAPPVKRETAESKVRRFYVDSGLSAPPPPARPDVRNVPVTSHGAEQLAAAGDWSGVLRMAATPEWRQQSPPAERVRRAHVEAIAYIKVKRPEEAYRVLSSISADCPDVPFSLKLLRASVAGHTAAEQLHLLLAAVNREHDAPLADQRRKAVTLELAKCYLARNDAAPALQVLAALAAQYPTDTRVLQRYSIALLQTGHVHEAQRQCDALVELPVDTPGREQALTTIPGLLATCNGDAKGAFTHFAKNKDARDCANTNNMAVSFMYNKHVPHAVKLLEQTARVNPEGLTGVAAWNLATLYDMMSDPGDRKSVLEAVAATYKGADFVSGYQPAPVARGVSGPPAGAAPAGRGHPHRST